MRILEEMKKEFDGKWQALSDGIGLEAEINDKKYSFQVKYKEKSTPFTYGIEDKTTKKKVQYSLYAENLGRPDEAYGYRELPKMAGNVENEKWGTYRYMNKEKNEVYVLEKEIKEEKTGKTGSQSWQFAKPFNEASVENFIRQWKERGKSNEDERREVVTARRK